MGHNGDSEGRGGDRVTQRHKGHGGTKGHKGGDTGDTQGDMGGGTKGHRRGHPPPPPPAGTFGDPKRLRDSSPRHGTMRRHNEVTTDTPEASNQLVYSPRGGFFNIKKKKHHTQNEAKKGEK